MISTIELKGVWFLPSDKNRRVNGTLFSEPNDKYSLEIFGSFDDDWFFPKLRDDEFILGITNDSKKVTLYNCFITKAGGVTLVKGEEAGTPITKYTVKYVLIGAHIENIDDLKFNSVSCEIFNLDEWVGVSGFANNGLDIEKIKRKEITVDYKLPDSIEFAIDSSCKGSFSFSANNSGWSRYMKNISITQRVEYRVDSTKEIGIEALLSYVFKFQSFLVLALYKSTFPTSICLRGERHVKDYGDGKPVQKEIRLYISISNRDLMPEPKSDLDMIFDYRRIREDFPTIIKNWYKKYSLLEPAFNLLFEQFFNGSHFNENTFLNLAQSAETFHARVYDHTRLPKVEYQLMKSEILESTSDKYHEWLNAQFNFGNYLNLHDRLTEIVEKCSNEILDKIIGNKEKFIKQVKHSRNYYTHYSESGKKNALKGTDLFYLSEKLKILLVCAFLMEVGFTKEKLAEMLDNVKWRFSVLWQVDKKD